MIVGKEAWPPCGGLNHRHREQHMNQVSSTGRVTAGPRKLEADRYKLWHEKPVGKFCLGFAVFVMAEILVYGTLHWIFPLI